MVSEVCPVAVNYSLAADAGNATAAEAGDWMTDFIAYWELMVMIIGAPMNAFVIYIWYTLSTSTSNRRAAVQSKNRWFILSMTLGDFLFASIHCPLFYMWYGDVADMTVAPCYLAYGATHLSAPVSSISLLLLNVDKFIYLHWPLHYHSMMTTRKAIYLTIGAWTLSFGWMFLFLFGPFVTRCPDCNWKTQHHQFYLAFLIVFFLMPILLSTLTSLYIATVAIRTSVREAATRASYQYSSVSEFTIAHDAGGGGGGAAAQLNGHGRPSTAVAGIKAWRTITFVFTTTIWSTMTYLPYRLSLVVAVVTGEMSRTWSLALLALMVVYVAGNPFITILTQPPYRRRAAEIFSRIKAVISSLWVRTDKV